MSREHEILAEFVEAQQLGGAYAEEAATALAPVRAVTEAPSAEGWQLEQQARDLLRGLTQPCSGPSCNEPVPLCRPRDPHPIDGPRYCSPRCRKQAWKLRHHPPRPVPERRPTWDDELLRRTAEARAWRRDG